MRAPLATAIAIAIGLIILVGYFVQVSVLQEVRTLLLNWAVILAGIATLVGVLNLLGVHWRKMRSENQRDVYSLFLVLAFIATLVAGLVLTPAHPQFQNVINFIQVPVETTFLAVLAISLAYASLRLLQRRATAMVILFMLSTVFFLLLTAGVFSGYQNIPVISGLVNFLNELPQAGMRGILLGIALGSLTTGLRILLGADRPYSG